MFQPTKEIEFAVRVVRAAAKVTRDVQQSMSGFAITKDDKSPVTLADLASQALVAYYLQQSFPGDELVGEESTKSLAGSESEPILNKITEFVKRQIPSATTAQVSEWIERGGGTPTGRFWTLDPVDGTKGFLRKEQYAIALALIIEGQVKLGVLGCPNLRCGTNEDQAVGTMAVAIAGQGAWRAPLESNDFQPMHVSAIEDPREARVLRSVESGHTNEDELDVLLRKLSVAADPVLMDSQAKYVVLASGDGDILLRLLSAAKPNYREKIWDQAAGSLVVQEAGGRITDLEGKPLDFSQGTTLAKNRGVFASNGLLHEPVLSALSRSSAV